MGMVRQWQQLLHGERYSHSYSESLPDFVKLAEAYGGGRHPRRQAGRARRRHPQMIAPADKPVIFDCRVDRAENCFPMIPSGKAHNEMILGENVSDEEISRAVSKEGKVLCDSAWRRLAAKDG